MDMEISHFLDVGHVSNFWSKQTTVQDVWLDTLFGYIRPSVDLSKATPDEGLAPLRLSVWINLGWQYLHNMCNICDMHFYMLSLFVSIFYIVFGTVTDLSSAKVTYVPAGQLSQQTSDHWLFKFKRLKFLFFKLYYKRLMWKTSQRTLSAKPGGVIFFLRHRLGLLKKRGLDLTLTLTLTLTLNFP